MSETVQMKQGDTGPSLTATLKNPDGTAANLSGATVKLNIKARRGGTTLVNHGTVTVTDATNGRVSYAWQVADTANPGSFYVEWEVTYAGGMITTYPNDKSALLEIVRQTA